MKFSARYLFGKRKKTQRIISITKRDIYSMRCFTYSLYYNVTNTIWFNSELLRCEFSIMPYIFPFLWLTVCLLASVMLTVTGSDEDARFSQMICVSICESTNIFSPRPFYDFILFYMCNKKKIIFILAYWIITYLYDTAIYICMTCA